MSYQLVTEIHRLLARMAWNFWTTLGVSGECNEHYRALVPLEELILLTAGLSKYDPRLRDEALDWCSQYHHFVSVSRLRTLARVAGEALSDSFSLFSSTLNSISNSNWPVFSKAKPIPVTCSGKSQPPICERPELLGLRLRSLFGVGARADLITFFVTRSPSSFYTSELTEIGYSKRTIAEVLDHFVRAGLLKSSLVGNQRKYELIRREELDGLVTPIPSRFVDLQSILTIMFTLSSLVKEHQDSPPTIKIVALNKTLEQLKAPLNSLNLSPPETTSDPSAYWSSFINWLQGIAHLITSGAHMNLTTSHLMFEKHVEQIMHHLFNIDDSMDGLRELISQALEINPVQHRIQYQLCYQTSIRYLRDLKRDLQQLVSSPAVWQSGNIHLLATVRDYLTSVYPSFCNFFDALASDIRGAGLAIEFYKTLEIKLSEVSHFLHTFKRNLKDLHFHVTDINLITSCPVLDKRHEVLNIFRNE